MHPVAQSALDVRVYQRGYNLVVRCFVDGELVFKDQFGGFVPVTPGRHTIRWETPGPGRLRRGVAGRRRRAGDDAARVLRTAAQLRVEGCAGADAAAAARGALDWSYVAWGAGFFLVLFAISLVVTLVSG